MSYQQTYRAVSTPVQSSTYNSSYNATQYASLPRKPGSSSTRSVSPLPPDTSSNLSPTYRSQPTNHSQAHSPKPFNPLTSFPPDRPSVSPSITPPVPDYQQPNYRQQPRAFFDSPASTTSTTFPAPPVVIHKKPQTVQQPEKEAGLPSQSQAQVQAQVQAQPQTQPQRSPAPSYTSTLPSIQSHEIDSALQHCLRIQNDAVTHHSKRPFAALLLAPDHNTVLLSHNSISHYQHAESELARLAAIQYAQKYLEKCTLVSTWEPCAMCAGTIYWTGIGRVIYGASEAKLKELTGPNNDENMTMDLPCRTIFNSGQRNIEVIGPVSSWEDKIVAESGKWWRENQLSKLAAKGRHERESSTSAGVNGHSNGSNRHSTGSFHEKATSVTVYNPNDSLLGRIREDGEYLADLKIDWMP